MKSLSLFSVVIITALLTTACSTKKGDKEVTPGPVTPEEKVVVTEESFVESLTTDSWVSACDKDQKRVRLEFQKSTNLMLTFDESCSRGERNSELEGTQHWYEVSGFDGESMHLQISSVTKVKTGADEWELKKYKNLQAFSMKVEGDKLNFVGILPEGESFPMKFSRQN